MKASKLIIGMLVASLPAVAKAQYPGNSFAAGRGVQMWPLSQYVWVEPHHASTAWGDYLRGLGAMLQGLGHFRYLNAMAATLLEDAYEHRIYNHVAARKARDVMRELYLASMEANKYRASPDEVSKVQAKCGPQRLNGLQLGGDGTVHWPHVLLNSEYQQSREKINALFHQRAKGSPSVSQIAVRSEIEIESNRMQDQLHKRLGNYNPSDYMAAKKFLVNLRYELRYDSGMALTSL